LIYFRRDWNRIIRGLLRSTKNRRIDGPDERLGWLLIVATIPVGIAGLLFEHALRTIFAKPLAASLFLTVNGLILLAGERARRRAAERISTPAEPTDTDPGPHGPGHADQASPPPPPSAAAGVH